VSPRPGMQVDARQSYRSVSPNPYGGSQRARAQTTSPQKRGSDQGYYRQNSPGNVNRAASPAPFRDQERPGSSHVNNDMSMQLAPGPDDYGSQGRSGRRPTTSGTARPVSHYGSQNGQQTGGASRQRSKSVAEVRQFNREGRPILNFGKSDPKVSLRGIMLTLLSSCTLHVSSCYSRRVEFCQRRYPRSLETSG